MLAASLRTQKLHAALVDFYSPGLMAQTWVSRAFELTSRVLSFSLNSHGIIDKKSGVLTANFDRALPGLDQAFSAFGRCMQNYAPFRFDPSVNGGAPFSARDFYSARVFRDLDIYQDVYRPMRFTDHCFVHVPTGTASTVFIGFMRDGRPFGPAEKELMRVLQPHLSNGRRLAYAMSAASDTPMSPDMFTGAGFTPRESDVLFWLTQGKANDDISKILDLRADSVSRHLQTIYQKLGVEHRVAASISAVELARKLHAEALTSQGGEVSFTVATR